MKISKTHLILIVGNLILLVAIIIGVVLAKEFCETSEFSKIETTCQHKLWFVPYHELGLHYWEAKEKCALLAKEYAFTVGFPSFFRNQQEYDLYRQSVTLRKEYLGLF